MTIIIPTIFALNKQEFENKLTNLKFSKKLHIDFMDGNFTNKKSIGFSEMNTIINKQNIKDIEFEVHLMAYEPLKYLKQIIKLNIKKVLIHIEVFSNNENLINTIKKFKDNNISIFIVLNPETKIEKIKTINKIIDGVMIMSVNPGKEGQKFIENSLNKINEIIKINSKLILQIDGGINDKNILNIKIKNIQLISVGSFISSGINCLEKYKILENIIK